VVNRPDRARLATAQGGFMGLRPATELRHEDELLRKINAGKKKENLLSSATTLRLLELR
jgi:hypothetical protein